MSARIRKRRTQRNNVNICLLFGKQQLFCDIYGIEKTADFGGFFFIKLYTGWGYQPFMAVS